MKKQILFLVLFIMATFTTTTAFGQGAVKYSDPRPLTCTDDALHPMAGRTYTYEATGTPTGGDFRFWATKDADFITTSGGTTTANTAGALTVTPGELLNTSTTYNTANVATSVDITWSSALLSGTKYNGDGVSPNGTPTFVAAYYNNTAAGCADNFKVWQLDPINGFTVDVLSLNPADFAAMPAYTTIPEQCPDIVRNATYASSAIHYDYGTNYLYYEFVAANFTGYWIPTFAMDATSLGNTQAATAYEYTLATPDTWGTTAPIWTALESGTTQIPIATSVTDTKLGVSVFVRVTIANNQWENLADKTVTMVLDGQNAEGLWDVQDADCALPSPNDADQNDTSDQVIKARPTIDPSATDSGTSPNTTIVPGDNQ